MKTIKEILISALIVGGIVGLTFGMFTLISLVPTDYIIYCVNTLCIVSAILFVYWMRTRIFND